MSTLIIIAHPNKHSFSHILANEYKDAKEKSGHEVRLVDLYDGQRRQDYLTMDEKNRQADDPLRQTHQDNITRSDEICFFFPLRWFDCPAILKNWFDVNYTNGFAYRYRKGKAIPEKLLTGKSVRVFITTGGPRWLYKTIGWLIITLPWYLGRIDYVGMKLKSWNWFTDMNDKRTPEQRQGYREQVKRLVGS